MNFNHHSHLRSEILSEPSPCILKITISIPFHTENSTMSNYPPYNLENTTHPLNQSQVHGAHQTLAHPGFISHNQRQQNQVDAQLDEQRAHIRSLPPQYGGHQSATNHYNSYPNSAQPDHNNPYHSTYPNSTYHHSSFNNVTMHGQQSHEYIRRSEPSQVEQVNNPTQSHKNPRRRREEPVSVRRLPSTIEPASSTSQNHLGTPTSTQTPAPPNTRAIVNLFPPTSLRGERNPSQQPQSNIPTPDCMMEKSSVELRMLAEKHAKNKETVPPALKVFFMSLHEELDKVLAINCLNNQVTVKAVRKLWYVNLAI